MTRHPLFKTSVIAISVGLSLSACAGESTLTVPTRAVTDQLIRPVAIQTDLIRIDVFGNQACPITKQGNLSEGLLVLPLGSTAIDSPLSIKVGSIGLEPGQVFQSPALNPISGGFDCGGQHWEVAYELPTSVITAVK